MPLSPKIRSGSAKYWQSMPLDGGTAFDLFIEYLVMIILLPFIESSLHFLESRKLGPREQVINVINILKWFCMFCWNTRPGDSALHERCRYHNILIWTKRHDDAWAT